MVWFVPHLRAVAGTTATGRISLLTKSRTFADQLVGHEDIVEEFIWIDHPHARAHPLTSLREVAAELRRRRFSRAWIMHHSPRYAAAAALAGIPQRAGYGLGVLQRLFLTDGRHLPPALGGCGAIERADAFLDVYGIAAPQRDLSVEPRALSRILARFAGYPRPWVGCGIGSSDPHKCWPLERFAEMAARLDPADRFTVFLCGAGHEEQAARYTGSAARRWGKATVPAVDLSLSESIALVSQCSLFVGNDSGPMNVAASLGVPTVGLFGGDVVLSYRQNLHAVAVPDGALRSMEGISVEQVLAYIEAHGLKPDARPAV